ncbi:MAG: MMPL family transporter [Propionibacteriaceae bacterium]|nr:MMPL family transporter [Propionibacteriaceae bacterium]
MFDIVGRSVVRHPWRAITAWLVVLVIAVLGAFWGFGQGGVFDRLSNSVSLVAGSESDTVNTLASADASGTAISVVVNGLDIDQDAPTLTTFMANHRDAFSQITGVKSVADPFLFPDPTMPQAQALLSNKKDGFIIAVVLDKDLSSSDEKTTTADVSTAVDNLRQDLAQDFPNSSVRMVSQQGMTDSIMSQIKTDLFRGESIGLPVALLLLIIIFGGILAAGLPIVGALVAIGIGMGSLWAMTFFMNVEVFTINIASVIGLSLSVDYGLLMVSRYREQLALILARKKYNPEAGKLPDKDASKLIVRDAMEKTISTAGRTVFFSAVTIAFAMCALLSMKAGMLRIIGISGIVVSLMAVLTAMTLVPAIIVLMRRVLIKPSIITRIPVLRSIVKAVGDSASDHGFFSKLARGVHKRPWLIMALVAVILVVMALPLRDLQMRSAFADYLPAQASQTQAYNTVQADYPALESPTILVVADQFSSQTTNLYDHLYALPDVDYISPPTPLPSDPWRSSISLHLNIDNQVGDQATQIVKDLRSYDAGYDIMVGGPAALQLDFVDSILARAPLALGIMALAVFILMFLMTGSVIVPIKAIIINSLSLLASLGVTSLIFMNGFLGMPKVQGMETFIVVCSICFGFGLAMDYEVFLISRIKEYWNLGLSNDEAVERGLQRSGRIITSAAAIIVAVFIGFTFGDMIPIKQIGVALAAIVVTDATLVRMLLVPATMTILGKWNWWSPKPLTRVYERLRIVH